MQEFISIDNLIFSYENSVEPLFDAVSLQIHKGWNCVVGANGSGKTTFLNLICGILNPTSGSVSLKGPTYYLEQRTDFKPSGFEDFLNTSDKKNYRIKNMLQIEDDWFSRWDSLSHGERKCCQIAVALFNEPLVLAVDEPSNHLDFSSQKILFNALKSFKGIGLVVSHDRELLDDLCQHTLFLSPPQIDLRRCNYSTAVLEINRENATKLGQLESARREVKKLKKKVSQQRQKADEADKLKSKRNIRRKDHDAKSKMDLARLTGKDSVEGRIHKRLKTQLEKAQDNQKTIHVKKSSTLGITFDEKQAIKTFPIIIPSTLINLGNEKQLSTPEITLEYGDKIGIIGDNGTGKSTFLEYMVKNIKISENQMIYIPQEIPLNLSKSIMDRIHKLDAENKGQIMTIINRLGSDPKHLLETDIPTPGEVRKLILSEGIMQNPSIIIMDEPTNHMDLPSIECIEAALAECTCTQLLVSHDHVFLKKLVSRFWRFQKSNELDYMVVTT